MMGLDALELPRVYQAQPSPWREHAIARGTAVFSDVQESPRPQAAAVRLDLRSQSDFVWMAETIKKLNVLLALPADWNGPGSSRIDVGVVSRALFFLASIAKPTTRAPSIAPGSDGSVQMAWYARGIELEITIGGTTGAINISLFDLVNGEDIELSRADPRLIAAIERLS